MGEFLIFNIIRADEEGNVMLQGVGLEWSSIKLRCRDAIYEARKGTSVKADK